MEKNVSHRVLAADGLRGLAMVAIVLFHLRPTPLTGGFVGVPVFFVLSGFFITVGLDRRIGDGSFNFVRYNLHRLNRLWAPMMASIALAVVLSFAFAPEYLPKMARDALPSSVLMSNWWLIMAKVPYFAAAGLPSPLKPLWFVALIMQFYLVWSLALWALREIFASDRIVLAITLALMLASSAEMGVLYDPADSGRVYYGLDTRLAELLAGAALAMIWEMTGGAGRWKVAPAEGPKGSGELMREEWLSPLARIRMDIAGWVAFVALVFSCFFVDGTMTWMYRGGYLASAILACVVLAACLAGGSLATVLAWAPLRHLGAISFSLYLVHYPIFEAMNPATRLEEPAMWQLGAQVVVVWAAAELFHRLIEKGVAAESASWRRNLTRGCALVGVAAVLVLTAVPIQGWDGYAHTRRAQAITAALREAKARRLERLRELEHGQAQEPARGAAGASSSAPVQRVDADKKRVPAVQLGDMARGGSMPVAGKVPANLDPGRWSWDARQGTSDARVLIIGDSVVLGAKDDIQRTFPNAVVDAQVGRQFGTAVDLYHQHAAKGEKGQVVVIALGANGTISSPSQIEDVIRAVRGEPVFFVTVRGPMTWTDGNNALLHQVVARHRDAGLLDWSGVSADHPEYFYDDGTHLTPGDGGGRQAWDTMLSLALCGR